MIISLCNFYFNFSYLRLCLVLLLLFFGLHRKFCCWPNLHVNLIWRSRKLIPTMSIFVCPQSHGCCFTSHILLLSLNHFWSNLLMYYKIWHWLTCNHSITHHVFIYSIAHQNLVDSKESKSKSNTHFYNSRLSRPFITFSLVKSEY